MRMDLIQPFIGSLDTVLAEMMKAPPKIVDLTMEEDGYRKKGAAALVCFRGQVEGRVILDMEPRAAAHVASILSEGEVDPAEPLVQEAVCELANMVIGNAVTLLNDRGSTYKVYPPELISDEQLAKEGADTEATVVSFETQHGNVYMNIAMRYFRRRQRERNVVAVT